MGRLVIVDRATRAIVDRMDIDLAPTVADVVLGRPRDIDRSDRVAWGNVTVDEVARLLRAEHSDGDDGLALVADLATAYPPSAAIWSVLFGVA